jgi:TolB-like protein/Tfp pilus assembly protein PilF
MISETKKQISIDLDQFKLHLHIEQKIQLSLHFNTPSRKFYLSVIAFVVNEMKKNPNVKSILLKTHHVLLALLNETVGGCAGSSEKEKLISRIYKKWKSDLPNLEEAPLFKLINRKKEYVSGLERIYKCSEIEKDSWACLFNYNGSGENVRLRFSVDTLGVSLDNSILTYGGYAGEESWERFVADLKKDRNSRAIPVFVDQMAFSLPQKTSIAVLPFDNISDDAEQDYIADGLTENIITGLSQIPEIFVIARNSSFTYKGKPINVKQVSKELGVKYVLEGSVQKAENRLRISAQLVDALKGHHLWAERYDRELKDFFELQDEISTNVLNAMHVKLVTGERAKLWRANDFEAWCHFIKGRQYFIRQTKEDNRKAREYYEKAVKIDPEYGMAWTSLAGTYTTEVALGSSNSPAESVKHAVEIVQKTSEFWPPAYLPFIKSSIYNVQGQYEKALGEAEKAVALDPNSPSCLMLLALVLSNLVRPEEAIVYAKKTMRLDPYFPAMFQDWSAWFYDQAGHYEEALAIREKLHGRAIQGEYPLGRSHRNLALGYARLDRMKEAREQMAEYRKTQPNRTLSKSRRYFRRRFTDQKYADSVVEMLRKAGLPE